MHSFTVLIFIFMYSTDRLKVTVPNFQNSDATIVCVILPQGIKKLACQSLIVFMSSLWPPYIGCCCWWWWWWRSWTMMDWCVISRRRRLADDVISIHTHTPTASKCWIGRPTGRSVLFRPGLSRPSPGHPSEADVYLSHALLSIASRLWWIRQPVGRHLVINQRTTCLPGGASQRRGQLATARLPIDCIHHLQLPANLSPVSTRTQPKIDKRKKTNSITFVR